MVRCKVTEQKHDRTLAHALKLWFKTQGYTQHKTVEMFLRPPYRLQLGALKSSLDVTDHPETTWNPKRGLSRGKVVFVHSVSSVGGMLMSDVYIFWCV